MNYNELRQELWKRKNACMFIEPPVFTPAVILSYHDWMEVKATMDTSTGDLQDAYQFENGKPHTLCGFNIYESENVKDGQPRFILE